MRSSSLTKKAEPPPTRDANRDSGTASANGGWLRRLVRPQKREAHNKIGQIIRCLLSEIFNSQTHRLQSQADNLHKPNHQNLSPATKSKAKMDACGLT